MCVCRGHTAGYLLGKAGVPKHAIITALGGTPTPNLAAFIEALKVGTGSGMRLLARYCMRLLLSLVLMVLCAALCSRLNPAFRPQLSFDQTLRQGQRVPVQFFTFGERHRRKSSLLTVNWRW